MGTRGITEVIYNGEIVVSQYGQWDHYPSGQGITAFKFLRSQENIDNLKKNLALVYVPSDDEYKAIVSKYSDERGMMTMEQGDEFSKMYPSLTRDTGAGILEVIANATNPVPLFLDLEFKDDRLFCEGVYTINLDDNTFTTRYNRYENDNDEDVYTLSFEQILYTGEDDYLERAKCGVYQYQKSEALA